MRELFINELALVSGAADSPSFTDGASVGAGIGGFLGAAQGGGVAAAGTAATAGAAAGAGLGLAGVGGYKIGELINENTPIQEWIADALDKLDGNDYCEDGGNY